MKKACAGTGCRRSGAGRFGRCRQVVLGAVLAAAVAAGGAARAQPAGRVTLAFDDIAAADAITQLRWIADIPLVFPPPPDIRISLSMLDVPAEAALTALCEEIGFRWTRVGRVYALAPVQRPRLLPEPGDLEQRLLHGERQRIDAARLLLTLTPSQVGRVVSGEALTYSELSPPQQQLLGGIYSRLLTGARNHWIVGAQDFASAPASPPADLAFIARGYVWRMEPPTAEPPPPAEPPSPAEPTEPEDLMAPEIEDEEPLAEEAEAM